MAAGVRCGVAKEANIFSYKVGEGSLLDTRRLLRALAHIRERAVRPAVINCSFMGDPSLHSEINALINSGIPVVVASGNGSPSSFLSLPATISVGLATLGPLSTGMNMPNPQGYITSPPVFALGYFGPEVDLFAPSSNIGGSALPPNTGALLSPAQNGTMYYNNGAGSTSLATAITTGVVAVYLRSYSLVIPGYQHLPAQIEAWLKNHSTKGQLRVTSPPYPYTLPNGAFNRMLHLPCYNFGPVN